MTIGGDGGGLLFSIGDLAEGPTSMRVWNGVRVLFAGSVLVWEGVKMRREVRARG